MTPPEFRKLLDDHQATGRKRFFLLAVSRGLSRTQAAEVCGVPTPTLDTWNRTWPAFASLYVQARETSVSYLEEVLDACANKAPGDPRYQVSLHFLLKSRKPEVYGDRQEIHMDAVVTPGDRERIIRDQVLKNFGIVDVSPLPPASLPAPSLQLEATPVPVSELVPAPSPVPQEAKTNE